MHARSEKNTCGRSRLCRKDIEHGFSNARWRPVSNGSVLPVHVCQRTFLSHTHTQLHHHTFNSQGTRGGQKARQPPCSYLPNKSCSLRERAPLVFTKSPDSKPSLSLFSRSRNVSWGLLGVGSINLDWGKAELSDRLCPALNSAKSPTRPMLVASSDTPELKKSSNWHTAQCTVGSRRNS